jgi:hypothetical protein
VTANSDNEIRKSNYRRRVGKKDLGPPSNTLVGEPADNKDFRKAFRLYLTPGTLWAVSDSLLGG